VQIIINSIKIMKGTDKEEEEEEEYGVDLRGRNRIKNSCKKQTMSFRMVV